MILGENKNKIQENSEFDERNYPFSGIINVSRKRRAL